MLRKMLGSGVQRQAMKAARANELTDQWLRRLNATSYTPASKAAYGELSSVLDFYHRQASAPKAEIDWDGFRSRIHTAGVVDKIQARYDKFMQTQYNVQSAVAKCGHETEKIAALDIAMNYNFMLYFVHYQQHLNQIETMRNIGDVTAISLLEMLKLTGFDYLTQMKQETADVSPQDYFEDGVYTRIATQFTWGARYQPPFTHSSDAETALAATLEKSGGEGV